MEDTAPRSSISSLRSDFRSRVASNDTVPDTRVPVAEDIAPETETPETEAPSPPRRRKEAKPVNQFTGPMAPAQFKLPTDLISSLKLHAIASGETMSEMVLRCLTSTDTIEKAWISTRKAS